MCPTCVDGSELFSELFSEGVRGEGLFPLSSLSGRVGMCFPLFHPIVSSSVDFSWGWDPALLMPLAARSGL